MKKLTIVLPVFFFLLGVLVYSPSMVYPCTAFCLKDGTAILAGKSYDWDIDAGYVIINKRNLKKTALPPATGVPARWVSKYGSITFNQYGKEFPLGGINEVGLMVEVLWLRQTAYPEPDKRPALGELSWVQFQLDTHSSVKEVIASDSLVRIAGSGAAIHFFVCDRSGESASIEFLEGKMVCRTGKNMPAKVLTNNTYDIAKFYLKTHTGFGGTNSVSKSNKSLDRFVRTAHNLQNYKSQITKPALEYGLEMLASVRWNRTQWNILYDIKNLKVYYMTLKNRQLRFFQITDFDFSCKAPSILIDINGQGSGYIAGDFIPYTIQINRSLIKKSFGATGFLKNTPAETLEQLAKYPDSIKCNK
ncbi:MAG: linear amide C-N hydrolase [bacterium]|nr:linear amide C-N hydrolase [bacterium]